MFEDHTSEGLLGKLAAMGADADAEGALVASLMQGMERAGFIWQGFAHRFLGRVLGLRIEHPPCLCIAGEEISSWTRFDPSLVCTPRDAERSHRCSEVTGVPLFPVAVDSFHLTIYSSPDGRFYGGFDSSVYFYGNDVIDFSEMLKKGLRPEFLGEWFM